MRTLNVTRISLFIKSYNLLVLLGLVYEENQYSNLIHQLLSNLFFLKKKTFYQIY